MLVLIFISFLVNLFYFSFASFSKVFKSVYTSFKCNFLLKPSNYKISDFFKELICKNIRESFKLLLIHQDAMIIIYTLNSKLLPVFLNSAFF